jgi:uncharacterized membrane protein YagU involved in acid resistance
VKTTASSAFRAAVTAGLIAGTVDIGAACLINSASPVRILHNIASGVLGSASFHGGASAAWLGLGLQWLMSIVIAAIYLLVTTPRPALRKRWWLAGSIAGIVIFLVMNFLVLPLSAAPVTFGQIIAYLRPAKALENLAAMLVFGWIVAFCARSLARSAAATGENTKTDVGVGPAAG